MTESQTGPHGNIHVNISGQDFKHLVPHPTGTNYTNETLTELGTSMIPKDTENTNNPPSPKTQIPAGYTFLGLASILYFN